MIKLREYAKHFKKSRPIFYIRKSDGGDYINVDQRSPDKYRPVPELGNPISELMCQAFYERFDKKSGEFVVNIDEIVESAMKHIRSTVIRFIENNLQMRNSRQSKLYRWYCSNRHLQNSSFQETLVPMYTYIMDFTEGRIGGTYEEHRKNAIILLQAIMEKYDKK